MSQEDAQISADPRNQQKFPLWVGVAALGGYCAYKSGWATSLLQLGAALSAGFVYMLYTQQTRMLYVPQPAPQIPRETSKNPPPLDSPRHAGIAYEDVHLTAEDGVKLHGWFMHPASEVVQRTAPTFLMFHGNAGNIGFRIPNYALMAKQLKCNILAVDYRGFGDSDVVEEITQAGLEADARAAWRHVASRTDIDTSRVFLFGRSLGGAVSVGLAAWVERERAAHRTDAPAPCGVVLENTFTSVADMAMHLFRPLSLVSFLVPRLVKNPWTSLDTIKAVHSPVLFLSGRDDALVPPAQMKRLVTACPAALKRFHVLPGGHNDTFQQGGQAYWKAILDFVRDTRAASARL